MDSAVEILRGVYENWSRGDFWTDDAIWHRDIELVFGEDFLDQGVSRGFENLPGAISEWLRAWEHWEAHLEDLIPAPDGRIVALVKFRGFGRTGGAPIETDGTHVWAFDDADLVTRLEIHGSRAAAERILLGPG